MRLLLVARKENANEEWRKEEGIFREQVPIRAGFRVAIRAMPDYYLLAFALSLSSSSLSSALLFVQLSTSFLLLFFRLTGLSASGSLEIASSRFSNVLSLIKGHPIRARTEWLSVKKKKKY